VLTDCDVAMEVLLVVVGVAAAGIGGALKATVAWLPPTHDAMPWAWTQCIV
jgi:hypothetical protein